MSATAEHLEAEGDAWEGFAPGLVIAQSYRLIRHLARGGMGDVYLATHLRLHSTLVVKVPNPETARDAASLARFRHEAELMIAARHPNVVQVIDFDLTEGGVPYLVMEYLPGEDLSQLLARRGPLPPSEILSAVRQVASALDNAHALGIVHRDLKPENIMVIPCTGLPAVVKIIDFGISQADPRAAARLLVEEASYETQGSPRFSDAPEETDPWSLAGTPEFMSPEQIQCPSSNLDGRSDQFSLAVIVYLLLTGRTPWGTREALEVMDRVVNGEALPLNEGSSWRWAAVEAVLARGMAPTASGRYDTTLAFAGELARAMSEDGLLSNASSPGEPSSARGEAEAAGTEHEDGAAPAAPSRRRGGLRLLRASPRGGSRQSGHRGPLPDDPSRREDGRRGAPPRRPSTSRSTRDCRPRGVRRSRAGAGVVGALVLIAVFCATWMGQVDPRIARESAERSWQSVGQGVKLAVSGSSGVERGRVEAVDDRNGPPADMGPQLTSR